MFRKTCTSSESLNLSVLHKFNDVLWKLSNRFETYMLELEGNTLVNERLNYLLDLADSRVSRNSLAPESLSERRLNFRREKFEA